MKYIKILSAVRIAIRHFVPLEDVKRLSNLVMEAATDPSVQRSTRMSDFTALYHKVLTLFQVLLQRFIWLLLLLLTSLFLQH